jgi:hypothetical protein
VKVDWCTVEEGAKVGIQFLWLKKIILLSHKKDDIQIAIKYNLLSAQIIPTFAPPPSPV